MTGELGLLILEASGPSNWPGCLSRGLRTMGWQFVTDKITATKVRYPGLRRAIVDNPFGKWPARGPDPDHADATANPQTLIDQWRRCRADPRCHQAANLDGFCRMVADARTIGVEVSPYIGWREDDVGINELGESLMPFMAARCGIYSDGLSAFPQDSWVVDCAKSWGIPFVGTEGLPDCGGVMDRTDMPAVHMDNGFDTPEKRARAATLKAGLENVGLLHVGIDPTHAVAWMQMGGTVYAALGMDPAADVPLLSVATSA